MITLSWSEGTVTFDGFELPEHFAFGGNQEIVTHKLIGGARIIDAMGPDDEPLVWSGRFLDEFANLKVFQLDLLRRSGREVQLQIDGAMRAYRGVVRRFIATMQRPYLYDYEISVEIVEDLVAGDGGAQSQSLEQEIAADIAAAQAYAEGRDSILAAIALASTAVRAAMGDRGALRGLASVALAEAQGAVGEAVFAASGQAAAANAAVAAVGSIGGVIAGGDPAQMAVNFLGATVSVEAASSIGLAAAHMTAVQSNVAQAPA